MNMGSTHRKRGDGDHDAIVLRWYTGFQEDHVMNLDLHPSYLYHGLSGWPPRGPNCFHWYEGRLRFSDHSNAETSSDHVHFVCDPSESAWATFWASIENLEVWDLPLDCHSSHLRDGLQADTWIERGSHRLFVHGQCCDRPKALRDAVLTLHAALQQLVMSAQRYPRLGKHGLATHHATLEALWQSEGKGGLYGP
jgi:hypothetical protein